MMDPNKPIVTVWQCLKCHKDQIRRPGRINKYDQRLTSFCGVCKSKQQYEWIECGVKRGGWK